MALSGNQVNLVFQLSANSQQAQAAFQQLAGTANVTINQISNTVNNSFRQINSTVKNSIGSINGVFGSLTSISQTLGLNLGGLANNLKSIGTAATGTAAALGAVGAALAVVGAEAAGLVKLGLFAADTGAKIFDLSERTGVSVRNIDLLRRAAAEAGIEFEVIGRSLDQFTSRLELGSKTSGEMNRTLKLLGIEPKDALKDVNATLEQAIIKLSSFENTALRGVKAQELFGLRNEKIISILVQLGGSLAAYEARVGSLGKITKEQAEQSKSVDISFNILTQTVKNLAVSLGQSLFPILQSGLDLLQTIVRLVGEFLISALGKADKALGHTDGLIRDAAKGMDIFNAALRASPEWIKVVQVALGEAMVVFTRFTGVVGTAAKTALAFFTGDYQGAIVGSAGVVAGIGGLTGGIGDKTNAAIDSAIKATQEQYKKLLSERRKLKLSGSSPFSDPGKPDKGGDAEAQAALRLLKLREQAIEREAQVEIAAARRAFEERKITIEQLEFIVISAERRMLRAKEATFEEERKIVEESKLKASEKQLKLAEIDEREKEAIRKKNAAIIQLEVDRRKMELAIAEDALNTKLALVEAEAQGELAAVNNALAGMRINETTAVQRTIAIEEGVFKAKKARLEEELRLAGENEQEQKRVQNELKVLEADRAAKAIEDQGKLEEAKRRDLQLTIQLAEEKRKAREQELQNKGFSQEDSSAIAGAELEAGRELSAMEMFIATLRRMIEDAKATVPTLGEVFVQTKMVVAGALADMIAAFVSGKSSMRQAVAAFYAAALAPLKSWLMKKATIQFALGAESLAMLDFAGAAKHYLAGAALSAAAGLIDAGGSAIAGSGASAAAVAPSGGSAATGPQSMTGRQIIENERRNNPTLTLKIETHPDVTIRRVRDNYSGNGDLRSLFRKDILQESPA